METTATILDAAFVNERMFLVALDAQAGSDAYDNLWPFEISKLTLDTFYTDITEDYRIQIHETAANYDTYLGSRIDVFN